MALAPAPLLHCEDLRVDVDGVPACDGLTLQTIGEHVLVLGAPRALFEATTGLADVVRGKLSIRETAAADAVKDGVVAGASLDPPMPPRWTVLEYVTWSARLVGRSAADAREAVTKLGLDPMRSTELARVVPQARRGTVVAAALATGAPILAIEDPLSGLAEDVARSFAQILVTALVDKAWIVFAARAPLTSPLTLHADEAIIASASRIDAQGAPAEIAAVERRFVARVHGPVDALAQAVSSRGGRVEPNGAQILVDLGHGLTTAELLGLCAAAGVTVIELVPVARALA